ncbi:transglutaminase [Dechloromonas sp. TW-R-39-2]|uniref:transglutaminase-like domain-containing protein n=1 Tax=Dechloromonas sp. TW-R-39-2 TaxID=2654218 RepID=UPI00193E98EB|nr:transglutaminase-like domain-containing protein [Dechloromonas sp. TW-R-39-2]QRM20181.1 transglutaminase [Dechloromonas sp. TW-R-39-2]
MKRRDFLVSAAALTLFAGEAAAAKKQSSAKATAGKSSSSKSSGSKKGATSKKPGQSTKKGRHSYRQVAAGPVTHTADDPVIERPPQGTSASRLPPVKAAEPPSEWRTYEITTTVNLKNTSGQSKLWLPLPLNQDTLFQRTLGHSWGGNPNSSSMRRLPDGDLEVFRCEWRDGGEASLQLTTLVTTADRHFDVTKRTVAPEREDILRRNLQASQLIPNEGLAFQLGERIVGRIKDPVAQAKAIYDWVVDNSIYDPSLPGCGTGDVRKQLIQGQYGGRSADINGLFVSICRAIGIPARCVYGLRVGPSRLFRSLGLNGSDATRGQHVRAEFYIPGYGWIPVDPSDVRRSIALEGYSDRDSKLLSLKKILFGVWEMNWIAFNVGNDITLPGQSRILPFLLLPQLESSTGRLDGTNPAAIQYTISTRGVEL